MKSFSESEIKYLAGLLDADGSLSFKFCTTNTGKTYVYLILSLTASISIDRDGYIPSLAARAGKLIKIEYEKESYSDANKWSVQSRGELNQLLPRILKHMVIKGKHWEWLYKVFCQTKGQDVTNLIDVLKEDCIKSRQNTGPIKPKKHPTWAWVAGYLDGDGCYTLSKKSQLHIGAIASISDICGLELLCKAFGGSIYQPREDNTQLWRRGLGKSHRQFAIMFLKKMHRHSRLKRWKIEQMLAFHSQPQRLNEQIPTGKVIV